MRADAPFRGHVLKRSVPLVEKQLIGRALVIARVAVIGLAFVRAQRLQVILPLHVIHDEQIEQTVVVYVYPSCRDGPERAVFGVVPAIEAGFLCDVGECTVAVVVVERVAMDAGDKDIRMAVVIVIADGEADIVTGAGQTGSVGYVREDAIAIVAKKPIAVLG